MEAEVNIMFISLILFTLCMVKRNFMGTGEKWVSLTNKTTTKNPETAIYSAL